jgi:hypothetical protein
MLERRVVYVTGDNGIEAMALLASTSKKMLACPWYSEHRKRGAV